jgi:hypothetical protein
MKNKEKIVGLKSAVENKESLQLLFLLNLCKNYSVFEKDQMRPDLFIQA